MLTPEQCLPGVEIICIDNNYEWKKPYNTYYSDWIKIGHIYTVREFKYSIKNGKPLITLNEIIGRKPPAEGAIEYAFDIWRFKRLDPKDIQIFYDILSKPVDFKISEHA